MQFAERTNTHEQKKNQKADEAVTEAAVTEEVAAEKVTPEPAKVETPVTAKVDGNLMYLGPTIVGVVRRSTTFKEGKLPGKLQQCITEYPPMMQLFALTDEIVEKKKLLNKKSSLATIYTQTAQRFARR